MQKKEIDKLISDAEVRCNGIFEQMESKALRNQSKVLDAFRQEKIALRHFNATTGYGYDDVGRDSLCKVYAQVFGTESALVSPSISSGTQALTVALFGVLRPNDSMLVISGAVYDTLNDVIYGKELGSLADFGISTRVVDLKCNQFDYAKIEEEIKRAKPRVVYIQRSRGYNWRNAFSVTEINEVIKFVKNLCSCAVIVDNCYGEFVDTSEPNGDLIVGSLIKNPGGGLAQCGGYIAGNGKLVDLCARRLVSPSTGNEVGSYASGYQNLFQGLFMAPHVVLQALKTTVLFSTVLNMLGCEVLPAPSSQPNDLICSIKFGDQSKLIEFCRAIQYCSPVDSFALLEPWDMPGYDDKVIMAAGCFVQGASIELSCDAPIRAPYIAYLQGSLTYEHGKLALQQVLATLY